MAATLIVKNPGGVAVPIPDIGISIPAFGQGELADPKMVRVLAVSKDFWALVIAGTLTVNDGTSDLNVTNAKAYCVTLWIDGGRFQEPAREIFLCSPDGTCWKVTIDDLGVVQTSAI